MQHRLGRTLFACIPCALYSVGAAFAEGGADAVGLAGTVWQWTATRTPERTTEAPDPARYTLQFQGDGGLLARLDCNQGRGSYRIEEQRLVIGPMMATRMACPPDSMDGVFGADLGRVEGFTIADGQLTLGLATPGGTMTFRAAP